MKTSHVNPAAWRGSVKARTRRNKGAEDEHHYTKTTAGFTLLEAMVVLAIFSIGILTVGSLQTRGVIVNTAACRGTKASALAATWMEKLIGETFDAHLLQDRNRDGAAGLDACTVAGADGSDTGNPPYTVFWNVDQVPAVFDPATINYKKVRVIVTWKERGTRRRLPLSCFRVDF